MRKNARVVDTQIDENNFPLRSCSKT